MSPARWHNAQVYQWEHRELAAGDRLQFRIHDKKHKVANGEFATILALTNTQAKLRLEGKHQRELTLPVAQLRHVDHGYAVTSHSSQGGTVERVLVNADSMRSARLVNREQFYVSVSRARKDAHVYTDNIELLRQAVGRERKKEIAMDAVKQSPTQELNQQPQQSQSMGIRI